MNIDTVNELIQSLESAGELSVKEQKYLDLAKAYADKEAESVAQALTFEKCRELSGCPAGVDLQDWVKQLAAENVEAKKIISECREYFIAGVMNRIRPTNEGYLHMICDTFADETPATDLFITSLSMESNK